MTLIDETIYTDCNLAQSTNYNSQIWQLYDTASSSARESLDCINICANKADEVYYVLGLLDKKDMLRRKIEIQQAHQRLYFSINLIQVDRWNIPESFLILIDGVTAFTWSFIGPVSGLSKRDYCGQSGNLAVEQDQIINAVFQVDHTSNIVEIGIKTTIAGKGQWALSSLHINADPCVSGACLIGRDLTFSMNALEKIESINESLRLTAYVEFNTDIRFLKGNLSERLTASISDGLDSSLYSVSMSFESAKRIRIYIDLNTSIRNRFLNISFPFPEYVRSVDANFTMIKTYAGSVSLPIVYYTSPSTKSISESLAMLVKYFGILLNASLIPMIVLRQFDVVSYTYFAHQMIFYYATVNVRLPANVEKFFTSFEVFSFSFLPNLFDSLIDSSNYVQLEGFKRIPLFISNAGYLFTALFAIIAVYLLCKLCASRVFARYARFQSLMKRLKDHIFEWNLFLEFAMLCVMHVLFAFFIQFFSFNDVAIDSLSIMSFGISVVTFVGLVAALVYSGRIMYKHRSDIIERQVAVEIEQKFGVLWGSCKRDNFWLQTCFYFHLMTRRVVFIFIICFVSKYVYTQFNIMSAMNIIVIFTVASFNPFNERRTNWKIILTEISLLAIQTLIQILRSDDSEDEAARVRIGWYIIIMVLILVLMHCGFILHDIIRYAKLWFVFQSEKAVEYRRILDEKLAPVVVADSKVKSPKKKDEESAGLMNEIRNKQTQVLQNMSPPPKVPFIQGLSESFDAYPKSAIQQEALSPRMGELNFSPQRQIQSPKVNSNSPQIKRQQVAPQSQFRPSIIARDIKANYDTVFQRQPTKQVSFISSVPSIPKDDHIGKTLGTESQNENRSLGNYIHRQNKQQAGFDSNHSLGKYINKDQNPIASQPPLRRKRTDVNSVQLKAEEETVKESDSSIVFVRPNRRRTIIHQTKNGGNDMGIQPTEYVPSAIESADNLRRRRAGVVQSQSSIRFDSAAEDQQDGTEDQPDDFDFKGFRQKRSGSNSKLNNSGSNASIKIPPDDNSADPDNFDFKGFRQKKVSVVQRQNSISSKQGSDAPNIFNPFEFKSSNTLKARSRLNKDTQLQQMISTESSPEKKLNNPPPNRLDRRKRNGFSSQTSIRSIETNDAPTISGKGTEMEGQKKRSRNVSAMFADEIEIPIRNRNSSIEANINKKTEEAGEVPVELKRNEEEDLAKKKNKKKTKGVRVDALQLQNIMSQENK